VNDPTLADYYIQNTLPPAQHWQCLDVRRIADNVPERLLVFSPELSRNPEFRRALKTDHAMLPMLQHPSVLKVLGFGESDGILFLRHAPCESPSLLRQLQSGRTFSTEDIIEIGWQICSALQRAHNLGLTHGRIAADSVLCSDTLQVLLAEFGIARWLEAAHRQNSGIFDSTSANSGMLRQQVDHDLTDLAKLLQQLVNANESPTSDAAASTSLQRLLNRCLEGAAEQRMQTAREFQGRLGELLIIPGNERMPVQLDKESTTKVKRSIVNELFQPDAWTPMKPAQLRPSAASASRLQILPLLVVVALIVILTVLAVALT
jgi:hypothetical protein